jgi:2-methylcitrate dehydratase PrpD
MSGRPDAQAAAAAGAPTRELAEFVSGLRHEALPPAVVGKAKICVLDALGCALFGATLPWTRMVADMVREQGGAPQALILGTRGRTSVSQAVLVNATAGHAFELDDAHTRASMHAGSINVAVALALTEWRGASGRDLITAVVAGYEVGTRVGMAGAGNLFKRGFHSAAVCGVFAAAATASSLLGLDAGRTQHAFGIAGTQAAGLMAAQEGAMAKRLHSGRAAQNGVYGALLAQRGFTGILDVLEAPFGGFFSAMTDERELEALTAGLGERWETLQIGFKPYATAGAIHASLAALDGIMREEKLAADDIAHIDVRLTTYGCKHVGWKYKAQGVASAQMNLYYALAVMAIDRAAMIEQFAESRLNDPRLLSFIERITINPDPELDAPGNALRYAMRMHVTTADGRRFERSGRHRPGSADAPLANEQLHVKFRLLAGHVLAPPAVTRVLECVSALEQPESVRGLIESLQPLS